MKIVSNFYSFVPLTVDEQRADLVISSFLEKFYLQNELKIRIYANLKKNIDNGIITTTTKNVTGTNTDNKTLGFTGFSSTNQDGTYEKEQNQNQNNLSETNLVNNVQDDVNYLENVKFNLLTKFENEFKEMLFMWILKLGEN